MVVKDKFLEANMLITQQTKLFLFEQNLSLSKKKHDKVHPQVCYDI